MHADMRMLYEYVLMLGLASIGFSSRSDHWLHSEITVDFKQDWSWSWT